MPSGGDSVSWPCLHKHCSIVIIVAATCTYIQIYICMYVCVLCYGDLLLLRALTDDDHQNDAYVHPSLVTWNLCQMSLPATNQLQCSHATHATPRHATPALYASQHTTHHTNSVGKSCNLGAGIWCCINVGIACCCQRVGGNIAAKKKVKIKM